MHKRQIKVQPYKVQPYKLQQPFAWLLILAAISFNVIANSPAVRSQCLMEGQLSGFVDLDLEGYIESCMINHHPSTATYSHGQHSDLVAEQERRNNAIPPIHSGPGYRNVLHRQTVPQS